MLDLINATTLAAHTRGAPGVCIGVIDGPCDLGHPALRGASVRPLGTAGEAPPSCRQDHSVACVHGTFVMGVLAGRGGERDGGGGAGLSPDCSFRLRPIFGEEGPPGAVPETTPQALAQAIVETVRAGAHIINISAGLGSTALRSVPHLREAIDFARNNDALVIAAAGNHGTVGPVPLFDQDWVIPVAACDGTGHPLVQSNLGLSIGRYGLLAPGQNVLGLRPAGGAMRMTGTSVAAPFVTGVAALLKSLYPQASSGTLRRALLGPPERRRSIIPPLLDAEASWAALRQVH